MLWLVTMWRWAHICKLLVIGLMSTFKTSNDDPEVLGYLQSSGLWVLAGLSLYTCSSSGGKSRMNAIISRPIPDVKTHLLMPCVTNPEIGHVEIEMNPCYWCVRPCLSMPELITMERNQVALRCGLQRSSSIRVCFFVRLVYSSVLKFSAIWEHLGHFSCCVWILWVNCTCLEVAVSFCSLTSVYWHYISLNSCCQACRY